MTERWKRMSDAFMPGAHTTWQSQWDAKVLRNLNENVWINQAIVERIINGDYVRDFELWEREL